MGRVREDTETVYRPGRYRSPSRRVTIVAPPQDDGLRTDVATPTLPRAQTPPAAGAAGAAAPVPAPEAVAPGGAPLVVWSGRLLGWLTVFLAAGAVLGFGPAVASLAVGRTALL